MAKMESNSISGIVTDPPYGISFMNKEWDHGIPGIEYWRECLRICKPGAYILAFGGTRTYHRLACAIEDAGWEIRDCVSWLYGSGFPKSLNISKSIDKASGQYVRGELNQEASRLNRQESSCYSQGIGNVYNFESSSDLAKQFDGYGTALKPAWEPILVCMKPCDGTFAQNAEKYGQAGINIDGCRIGTETTTTHSRGSNTSFAKRPGERLVEEGGRTTPQNRDEFVGKEHPGRWPANLVLDEEAAGMLDDQSGTLKSGMPGIRRKKHADGVFPLVTCVNGEPEFGFGDSVGASRFFYCAKASSAERNRGCEELPLKEDSGAYGEFEGDGRGRQTEHKPSRNNHPTVKPIKLMEYLITLIAPPKDAIILDPFMGSGTTILACQNLGINCVGIEMSADYCEIAKARVMGNETLFSPKVKFV